MKICPKCAQSFADGFKYCPKDATALTKYDLRSRMQPECNFLLAESSLIARLKNEATDIINELKRSPRSCAVNLFRGEGSSRRRRHLLQAGMATAVITYSSILLIGLIAGLFKSTGRVSSATPPEHPTSQEVRLVVPSPADEIEIAKHSEQGLLGGSMREPKRAGGGGGTRGELPTSRGQMPTPSLDQQINLPDFSKSHANDKSLIVPETVQVDPALLQRLNKPIGIIDGQSIPSLGNGEKTGVGPGNGPGHGPGNNGNTGGKDFEIGGGPTTGPGNREGIPYQTPTMRPTILYKEKARYTEEARANKIEGVVMLNVVFGADGRIQNIRVLKGLSYGLTESAIEAAQRIRFQPATANGKPVSVRGNIEYNFNLY